MGPNTGIGFIAFLPSQVVATQLRRGRQRKVTLLLVRPLGRRSGCVPAEPYPPLRSLEVYRKMDKHGPYRAPKEKTKYLKGAALSYMGQFENVGC